MTQPTSLIKAASRQLLVILSDEADTITNRIAQAYVTLLAPTATSMLRVMRGAAPKVADQYEALPLLLAAWVDAEAQVAALLPIAQPRATTRRGSSDPAGRLLAKLQRGWRQTPYAPPPDRQVFIAAKLWEIAQNAAEAAVLGDDPGAAIKAQLEDMGLVAPMGPYSLPSPRALAGRQACAGRY